MNSSASIDCFRLHDRPYQHLAIEIGQKPKTLELGEDDQRRSVYYNHSISFGAADHHDTS